MPLWIRLASGPAETHVTLASLRRYLCMNVVLWVSVVIVVLNAVLLGALVLRYRGEQRRSQQDGQLEHIGQLWEARAHGVGGDRRASAA